MSEHFKVDYDLYFAKILQTIFVTFSLSQLRKDNQDYFLKSDEDFIDHLEDGSEETAKGYYSRGSVCELIEREVSS